MGLRQAGGVRPKVDGSKAGCRPHQSLHSKKFNSRAADRGRLTIQAPAGKGSSQWPQKRAALLTGGTMSFSYIFNFAFIFLTPLAGASEITTHDIPGLPGTSIELRFSNPLCGEHIYEEEVLTNSGDRLTGKPANLYCRGTDDYYAANEWDHSPRAKLIQWINDPMTQEIFFAFQTITEFNILNSICEAIKARNIPVTFVLSRNRVPLKDEEGNNIPGTLDPLIDVTQTPIVETEGSLQKMQRVMDRLTGCDLPPEAPQPVALLRGHTGRYESNSLGWAHNKYFVVNPSDPDTIKFATGSGNLTSAGTASNHENWLFFDNVPTQSYLAQSTLCMKSMQESLEAQVGRREYAQMNEECLATIDPSWKKARGIETYFVPGQGQKAINEKLIPAFSQSKKITVVTHLIGFPELFNRGMKCAASPRPVPSRCHMSIGSVPAFGTDIGEAEVRLITDDDIHWIMVGQTDENGKVGYNQPWEARLVEDAEKSGVQTKFLQTAHHDSYKQLQHNKIILFEGGPEEAVWTGAGNLTGTAMYSNFENYYYITIPSVVEAYKNQLNMMWNEMATGFKDMPAIDTTPVAVVPPQDETPEEEDPEDDTSAGATAG